MSDIITLKALCEELKIDPREAPAWMDASRQAHQGNYAPMVSCLTQTLTGRSQAHGDTDEEPEHD